MKKKLFIISLCLLSVVFLTGCSIIKKALSAKDFNKIVEKNDMVAINAKEQFKDHSEIETATLAIEKDKKWQVEHYTLSTKADAKKMFDYNKSIFETEKSGLSKDRKIEYFNYTKYTLETDTYYMVASRIDNTFLYAKVPIEYKDAAIQFIKETGY